MHQTRRKGSVEGSSAWYTEQNNPADPLGQQTGLTAVRSAEQFLTTIMDTEIILSRSNFNSSKSRANTLIDQLETMATRMKSNSKDSSTQPASLNMHENYIKE